MTHQYASIAFTDNVKSIQQHYGSAEQNQRLLEKAGPNRQLGPRETTFISERDTFYLSTVSETGWPYVQHRGGPAGFLKVVNPTRLAYADFRGNTQLITVGNAAGNDRCSLLLIDYAHRQRLKVLGHLHVQNARESPEELQEYVTLPDYTARIERLVTIDVVAFDWNCPQHIAPRYTAAEAAERRTD